MEDRLLVIVLYVYICLIEEYPITMNEILEVLSEKGLVDKDTGYVVEEKKKELFQKVFHKN